MENQTTDGLLLRLIPPSLQELELTINWRTPSEQIHRLFTGLSHPVLSLRTVRINWWQPEQVLLDLDPLLNVTSIRYLTLKGNIVLGAGMLYKILSDLALVSIQVTVRDLKAWNETIHCGNLEELHCAGTCADIAALVTHLHAPNLTLKLDIVDAHFDRTAHSRLCQTLLGFTLRSLQLRYKKVCIKRSRLSNASDLAPMPLFSDDLKALSGRLALEDFTLHSEAPSMLTDDHILQMAKGWPMLRSLSLSVTTNGYVGMPTPTALVHLARNCPNLRSLRIQLHAHQLATQLAIASLELRALRHPLRTLWVLNAYDWCQAVQEMAEFLDNLFPCLAVETCEGFDSFNQYDWGSIWRCVRDIQTGRRDGRQS